MWHKFYFGESYLCLVQAKAVHLLEKEKLPKYATTTNGFVMNNLITLHGIHKKMEIFELWISNFVFLKSVNCLINVEYEIMLNENEFPDTNHHRVCAQMENVMKLFAMLCQDSCQFSAKHKGGLKLGCPMAPGSGSSDAKANCKKLEMFQAYEIESLECCRWSKAYSISELENHVKQKGKDLHHSALKHFLETNSFKDKNHTLKTITDRKYHPFYAENVLKKLKLKVAKECVDKATTMPRKTGIFNSTYEEFKVFQ